MTRSIVRAAGVLVTMLLSLLVGISVPHPATAVTPAATRPVSSHAYEGHGPDAVLTYATTERGPPPWYDAGKTHGADDLGSHRASARPAPSIGVTYDAPTTLGQVAQSTTTTKGQARVDDEVASSLGPSDDATEAEAGASRVNPLGGTQNCVNCATAGDHTLAGFPMSALDSANPQLISKIEQHFGASFKPVSGRADIEDILSNAGLGSRGIVFGARGSDPGHVLNAINQGGVVRFIDFQSGRAASFNGYSGFSFLRTN